MATNRLLAATAAGVFMTGGFLGSAETAPGQADRGMRARQLLGASYEKMLALARYLDETAQGALEGADDEIRRGSNTHARFLPALRAFAVSTAALVRTVSECQATSLELPAQLADLQQRARLFDDRIRAAHALETIYKEWGAVADVLERMTLLLAGHDVEIPNAYVTPALAGPQLEEIRRLGSELEASAISAHGKATRAVGRYRDRGQQFLGELRHFSLQSRDLRRHVDAHPVDPQRVGPVVDHVLEEARQADRRMRDAPVFTEVWDDSSRSIVILQRMARLVRSCAHCEPESTSGAHQARARFMVY